MLEATLKAWAHPIVGELGSRHANCERAWAGHAFLCGHHAVQSLMEALQHLHSCDPACSPVGCQGEETAPHHNQHD